MICKLNDISKAYGSYVIFNGFNLEIDEGEMVCIKGASGSGKSTLLNLIGMFDVPDSGEIELFGKTSPKINSKDGRFLMREKIFYCFQNFALVDNESIRYNLNIPLINRHLSKKEKELNIKMALQKVGLDKNLDEKVYCLSGGEQQRVAIARAFLKNYDLVLADEPTGSLDADNRDAIMNILTDFHERGKTIVIVSHDQAVINRCNRVIEI